MTMFNLVVLRNRVILVNWANLVIPRNSMNLMDLVILVMLENRAARIVAALQPGCEEMKRE